MQVVTIFKGVTFNYIYPVYVMSYLISQHLLKRCHTQHKSYFMGAQWELQTVQRGIQISEWDSDTLNADIVVEIINFLYLVMHTSILQFT